MRHFKKIGFLSAFIIPALVVIGFYLGGAWNFLFVAFDFILIPIADYFTGLDKDNVPDEEQPVVGEALYYRFVIYLWVLVQFGFFGWTMIVFSAGGPQTWIAWVGFTIGVAFVTGGIGITVAHELGHKKPKLEQFFSQALLMTVCYMHFFIEHNRGHHVHVGTPADPATAKKNQSFYAFWLQTVPGSWLSAWKIETTSLQKRGLSLWSIHNKMLHYTLLPLLFCGALTFIISNLAGRVVWEFPVFFFVQSILAFSLLELVNYVEHYGISRKELAPLQYERVNPNHSWNAGHMVSNFFLFQLQRHSDHHYNASKRYQILDHYDESPQLPFGYPTMILLALIPTLWFSKMNQRLEDWEKLAFKSSTQQTPS